MEHPDIIILSSDDESKSPVQVTSPKLSLKRNRTELTPDRKFDERSANRLSSESVAKKIKFDRHDAILNEEHSAEELQITSSTIPPISVQMVPGSNIISTVQVIDLSDEEEQSVSIGDKKSEEEIKVISGCDSTMAFNDFFKEENNIYRERRRKFMELLDFSAGLMQDEATDEEKIMIANRLMNLLNATPQSYLESENFNLLLDISLKKLKRNNCNVYDILDEIKQELKKHKKEKKKTIKGSVEDIRISSTDDSISRDNFIESTSSLPLPSKVTKVYHALTNLDFTSRFQKYFKASEKQQLFQADCVSSLTSESTKTSASNKSKSTNDSENNLKTIPNSNEKLISANLTTNEINASAVSSADGLLSIESNTSEFPSLKYKIIKNLHLTEISSDPTPSTSKMYSPNVSVSNHNLSDDTNRKFDLLSLQTSANSKKNLVSDNFVTNEISSSECTVSENIGVDRRLDLSLPSTSLLTDPADKKVHKFVSENDNLFKSSHSGSDDPSIDQLTPLEKNIDDRNARRIKKLEKYLKDLDKKIKKCQSRELSLDDLDNEDSTYIMESKYKRKFVSAYKLLCKFKQVPARTGRIIEKKFHYQGSRYRLINEAIEKFINKRKAYEKFPNYSEVLKIIKQVDERHDLGFDEIDISNEAKRVFEDIGEELKKRRCRDQQELFGSYLTDDLNPDDDPAEKDEALKKTLEENNKNFNETLNKIIDHYAEKQKQATGDENDDDKEEEEEEEEKEEEEEEEEKEEEEEETITNSHDDSEDLPRTAPASPEQNDQTPVINIMDRDDDIEIVNYSDKSTDKEEDIKVTKASIVNKPSISESIIVEDSESSGDLPSIQELMDR